MCDAYVWVVLGTTLGMMLANAPVVWLGERIVKRVPIRLVHGISAAIFLVLGRCRVDRLGMTGIYSPDAPICTSLRALNKCS